MTEARAAEKPFPDKWSLKETLGHLIDSVANNHQRIVRMQESPDIGAFSYSQQHWVSSQHYQDESWQDMVELWYRYNAHLAHVISRVDPVSLDHVCDVGHARPSPLRFIIEDYVRHLEHHLGQIFSDADPRSRAAWVARDPA
jgi:hypothetical protein